MGAVPIFLTVNKDFPFNFSIFVTSNLYPVFKLASLILAAVWYLY